MSEIMQTGVLVASGDSVFEPDTGTMISIDRW